MLFDLVLHGFLDTKYTDALEFIPTWVNKWLGPTGALPTVGNSSASSDASMSTGLAVLIAICILVFGIVLGGAAAWFYLRNKLGIDVKAAAEKQPHDSSIAMNESRDVTLSNKLTTDSSKPSLVSRKSGDDRSDDSLVMEVII